MVFSSHELEVFTREGFILREGLFSADEAMRIKSISDSITANAGLENRMKERDNKTVRSAYGAHAENNDLKKLTERTDLVQMAMQLVGDSVHVFQFKLNAKRAIIGAGWPWHQDYTYFHKEDGMPLPRCVNAVLFLDDVDEFNGPVTVVPRSHKKFFGITPGEGRTEADEEAGSWAPSPSNASGRYPISINDLKSIVQENGIIAPKGRAGSVLFFHVNTVHASQPNMSPFDRSLALITYNATSNAPSGGRRAEYIASSDARPILPLSSLPPEHLDKAMVA